ncbi:MAG: PAS domain S-box protein [Anaerolineales bacterium]|nr:PAS domain S-box protein [Anaerolineales bacterium]MDW8445738.1 PAS domain S-box protein [Anaerolineales bacterium]
MVGKEKRHQSPKETEAWFRAAFYSIGDAAIATDRRGFILQMNPEAERLTGWREDEAQGKPLPLVFRIINQETRSEVENFTEQVLGQGVTVRLGNCALLTGRNGEQVPIIGSAAPIRGKTGEINGLILVFRNWQCERRAEQLAEAARRYAEAIIETVREALLVLDADLRVVSANRSFYRLFRVTPEETVGRYVYELGNRQWNIPALRKLLEEILPNNSHFEDFQVEHVFETIGRRVMLLNARRVFQEGQRVPLILLAIQDATERKRAEEALRLDEERYRIISEMISDYACSFRVEEDGSLRREWLVGGFERVTGYTPEESQVRGGWRTLIYPPDLSIAMHQYRRAIAGEPSVSEFRILRKDGRVRWIRNHALPIWDEQASRIVRIYGAAEDITEQKQRELELKALAQFSRAVSEEADFQRLAERLTRAVLSAVPSAQRGSLAVAEEPNRLRVIASVGYRDPAIQGITYPIDWGFAGRCFRTQQPILITDAQKDEEFRLHSRFAAIEGIRELRSAIVAPLHSYEQVIGILSLESDQPHAFTEEDLNLLNALAHPLALALHNVRLHQETAQHARQLQAVQTVGKALIETTDVRLVFEVIVQQLLAHLNADAVGILLHNPLLRALEYAAQTGFRLSHYEQTFISIATSPAGQAAREHQVITITDLSKLSPGFAQLFEKEEFQAYGAAPLFAKGKLKGVLEVFYRRPFSPTPDWKRLFEMLADQAALAIDNAEILEDLRRANLKLSLAYEATIEGWSRALELRDKETEGHTLRVTEATLKLAEQLGVEPDLMPHIRRGCLLHDIGKIAIPDSILFKAGPLNDEEWALMRQHPQIAYDLLSPIEYLLPALNIPYFHHERWDGRGYPRGLRGEEIPLEARIFAVIDVWDALISDRPYRKAWSRAEALNYIREQAGKQFDPRVVEAFLKLVEE